MKFRQTGRKPTQDKNTCKNTCVFSTCVFWIVSLFFQCATCSCFSRRRRIRWVYWTIQYHHAWDSSLISEQRNQVWCLPRQCDHEEWIEEEMRISTRRRKHQWSWLSEVRQCKPDGNWNVINETDGNGNVIDKPDENVINKPDGNVISINLMEMDMISGS